MLLCWQCPAPMCCADITAAAAAVTLTPRSRSNLEKWLNPWQRHWSWELQKNSRLCWGKGDNHKYVLFSFYTLFCSWILSTRCNKCFNTTDMWTLQVPASRVLAGTYGRVLEVGSGTGAVSRHLAKLPEIQVPLFPLPQYSPMLLDSARSGPQPPSSREGTEIGWRSGLHGGVRHQAAPWRGHPPFPLLQAAPQESVDTAVLWTTLLHVPQVQQADVLTEVKKPHRHSLP